MTYNKVTKTMSVRVEHGALRVLEWKAQQDGVPLRTVIRNYLQQEAERITEQYNLALPDGDGPAQESPPPEPDPVTMAAMEAEGAFSELDEFEQMLERESGPNPTTEE